MSHSNSLGRLALSVLAIAAASVPVLSAGGAALENLHAGLVSGSGRGTIQLPGPSSEGLMVGMLASQAGDASYGLDAVLTTWIPSGAPGELARGGIYGQMFEAFPGAEGMKAYVEGEWTMLAEHVGVIKAAIYVADQTGELHRAGSMSGKLHVGDPARGVAGLRSAGVGAPGAAGEFGVRFVLAD